MDAQPHTHGRPAVILGLGALYEDILLTVPHYPREDEKLRSTRQEIRLGGNLINTFTVLAGFPQAAQGYRLVFCGAVGSYEKCGWLDAHLRASRIEPVLVYHAGPSSLPQAFIINSQATGSRTIISHRGNIPDVSARDLIVRLVPSAPQPEFPAWVHIEGRNCPAVHAFLAQFLAAGFPGAISIDCESVRDGLAELIKFADVVFLSESFARNVTGFAAPCDDRESHGAGWGLLGAALNVVGEKIKPGAHGYLTLGAHGVWVFVRLPTSKQLVPKWDEAAGRALPLRFGPGLEFLCIKVDADKMSEGEVVETAGAGDTFIAGVIFWGVMSKAGSLIGSARFATLLAGAKCRTFGFKGLCADKRFAEACEKLGKKTVENKNGNAEGAGGEARG